MDGNKRQKQGFYMSEWRCMTPEQQAQWQLKIRTKTSDNTCEKDDKDGGVVTTVAETVLAVPTAKEASYSNAIDCVIKEYKTISESHSSRLQHVEDRYHMYRKLAGLVVQGAWSSCNQCASDQRLACLSVERKKLVAVHSIIASGACVPEEVPPCFRTG